MMSLPCKVFRHLGSIPHSKGRHFYSACRSLHQHSHGTGFLRSSWTPPKNCLLSRNVSTTSATHGQKTFELNAGPFGNLTLESEGAVNTHIKYLDPQAYPLQNKVLVKIQNQSDDSEELDSDTVHLEQDVNDIKLIIKGSKNGELITCLTNLPIKFDIDAHSKDTGTISVEKFENDSINIRTEYGACRLKGIQTGTATVISDGGDVIVDGVIQGNSDIKARGSGNVRIHRIQGLTFRVETDAGNIEAKAVYADDSDFVTCTGDIHIGSGHRNCTVQATSSGNISIGDIDIKLSDSLKTKVDIQGLDVDISKDFDVVDERKLTTPQGTHLKGVLLGGSVVDDQNADILGELQRHLTAKTGQGHVKLASTDWFSSLNLMKNVD